MTDKHGTTVHAGDLVIRDKNKAVVYIVTTRSRSFLRILEQYTDSHGNLLTNNKREVSTYNHNGALQECTKVTKFMLDTMIQNLQTLKGHVP